MDTSLLVVEVGATNLRRADILSDGKNIKIKEFYREKSGSLTPRSLFEFVKAGLKEQSKIAYAVAGPTKNHSTVKILPNLPSFPENFDLKTESEKKFSVPSVVLNDMTAAVLGMAYLFQSKEPFWGITWSTGLGGKFFDGRKIADENLEIGHMVVDESPNAPQCGCGQRGHIEAFVSGSALEKKAGQPLSEITKNFLADDKDAIKLYVEATRIMGGFLAKLQKQKPAKIFCFKGGVALHLLKIGELKKIILDQVSGAQIIFSPEPEKDTFFGAARYLQDLD